MAQLSFSHNYSKPQPGTKHGESDSKCLICLEAKNAKKLPLLVTQKKAILNDKQGPVPCGSGNSRPQLLDLCCGLGGWSIGFHRAGFKCTGVDVLDLGYPYDLILADVCSWHPREKTKTIDVVTASPPCTEWSQLLRLAVSRGQRGPGEIYKGLKIVEGCIRIIKEVNPRFWILENVAGGEKYITPILGSPKLSRGPWRLWGEFPSFLLPENPKAMKKTGDGISSVRSRKDSNGAQDKLNSIFAFNPIRSWFRAKIPLPLSVPLGEACREALL